MRWRLSRTLWWVGVGAGAGLLVGAAIWPGLVAGVVVLVLTPPGDRFERAPTWHLGVGLGGLAASGRF